jgi:hypothetical protein
MVYFWDNCWWLYNDIGTTMIFYATFGSKHLDGVGADKYVIIEAKDRDQAGRIMYAKFGPRWSHIYDDPKHAGIDEYNLKLANPFDEAFTAFTEGVD